MQIPREQIWQEKLCQLTGPSYLESVWLNDVESKKKIDLTTLKQPIHTTIKSKIMFAAMIIFILGCIGLWVVAYMHSTLPRLTNGVDFRADACGLNQLQTRRFLYFPAILQSVELIICVSSCPGAIANYVCLYDENGTDYDLATQGQLCYQTIQSSNQGKYCMPYQPITSDVLSKHLSKPDSYMNRLLSDIGNSWASILMCIAISMLLGCLTNLFLLRKALFIRLSGWIATIGNLLLMLVLIILSFLQLSSYQQKYCIGSEPDDCLFGNVLTYKALSYLLVALAVLFTLCQLVAFRKIRASTDLGGIAQTLSSQKRHVGVEIVILISKLIVTLFFGSLILMAASDSQIVQTNVPDIVADTINVLKFNTRRYWVAGLGLLMQVIAVTILEKIRYFVIAIDTVSNLSVQQSIIQVKEAVRSTICHSGELLIIVLLQTLLLPLWLLSRVVYWIFSDTDKSSSTSRYLQEHILFFPQLWLYSHLFRYLQDQALVFLPYDLTYAQRIRLYHLMDVRRYLKLKMLSSVKFCSRQVGLFLSLFAAAIAVALSNMAQTITGLPTTLIENQLIPLITTFLLCLLLASTNTFLCVPFIEALFNNHQLLMESGRQSAAKDMRQKYHMLFDGQNDQLQVTKEHLNQTALKTQGLIEQPSYEPDLIKIQ